MAGFENEEQPGQEINVTDVDTAAKAIEGFLDEGQENNPAQGQRGAAEAPADGEEIEQFAGQSEEDYEAETQHQEVEQEEEEQQGSEVEEQEASEEDESPLYAVTVQGEEQLVPLEDLTKGYMLQSDYTKKTQQLAQERQEFAEQAQGVVQERQQYVTLLTALEQQLSGNGEPEPDWQKMSVEDPVGYVRKKAAWDHQQQVLDAARTEKQRVTQLQQQDFARKAAEYNRSQVEAIMKAKPELKDPEKAKAYRDNLLNYGVQNYGYTPQEMAMISDHRYALILEKAMLYDQAAKKGGAVQKHLKKGKHRQVIRPGAAQAKPVVRQRQDRQNMERLRRTGDIRDAAAAMEKLL